MTKPTTHTDRTRSWQPYRRSSPLLDALGGLEEGPDGAVRMTVQDQHCNNRGQLHGGIISAYADFIIGHHLEHLTDQRLVTTSLTVHFMDTAQLGDTATGLVEPLRVGGRTAVGRLALQVEDRLIADITGLYLAPTKPDPAGVLTHQEPAQDHQPTTKAQGVR
jgi:uncharacterized protein (TIGR00369 family)